MEHAVKTYNLNGKFMYESQFVNAEETYKEYCDIIENAKKTLPKGYGVTVVRFKYGKVMTIETVVGTH